jgi:crotonobetainyl-CoA:carnitine CoA-transferase CaiB-like acyl-CoA transferase
MSLLTGVKVIDITDGLAGPIATQIMADYGAEIVRVDRIGASRSAGDLVRLRGRRSIAVDVVTPEGRDLVERLVAAADVLLVETGLDAKLRFDASYATLSQANLRLIYCRITGHGDDGPMVDAPSHDHLVAARYGVYNQVGYRDGPTYLTANVPSLGAGLLAVQGIGSALYVRERTGRGQEVATSLLAGALAFQPGIMTASNPLGAPPPSSLNRTPQGGQPFYSLYECADGEWLHFGCLSPTFQDNAIDAVNLRTEMSLLGFGTAKQADNVTRIIDAIAARMRTRTFAEWAETFEKADVPYARAQWTENIMDDPQVQHETLVRRFDDPTAGTMEQMGAVVTLEGEDWQQVAPTPLAGQDTDLIVSELGYTPEQTEALRRDGVIA